MKRVWFILMILLMTVSVMAQPKVRRQQKTETKAQSLSESAPSQCILFLLCKYYI